MTRKLLKYCVFMLGIAAMGVSNSQTLDLGNIDFPTSTVSKEAQAHFLQGTMMLHSFEWEDAADAFRAAQEVDSDFVMAYWGEALSHTGGHHFPPAVDLKAARVALEKLGKNTADRLEKAETERERGFLEAVELLYGEGDDRARANAYRERMEALSNQFPNDHEPAAFHALSLMRSEIRGPESLRVDMQAGAIAQQIFRENPDHPGAAHYVIHAYDDPIHAPIGLHAALKYADIAPAAVHALHMPSHMFVQLGMWDRLAASNEASYQTSVDRANAKGLPPTKRSFHAIYWLHYAYIQQGRLDKAQWCLDEIAPIAARSDAPEYLKSQLMAMRARQMIVTKRWEITPGLDDLIERTIDDPEQVDMRGTGVTLLAAGMAAVATDDLATAKRVESALETLATSEAGIGANQIDISHKEVAALIRLAEGDQNGGLRLLEEAVAVADSMVPPSGPPGEQLTDGPVKPAHELYGETLLGLERSEEALSVFKSALLRMPQKPALLLGAARAAENTGDHVAASRYYQALLNTPDYGDDLLGAREASAYLGGP